VAHATHFDLSTLEAFTAQLLELDRRGALDVVEEARRAGGSLESIVTGLLAPSLVDVGRRWAAAEVGIAEAQAAAAIVRTALLRCASAEPGGERPLVAVCSPEGEPHDVPAEMVGEVLRAAGWPVDFLGTGIPASDLHDYLDRRHPSAILVSCTTPCGLPGAARVIDAAHDVAVPTIVGGAGFGRDNLRALRLGAAAWAPTPSAAARILEEWADAPPSLATGRALTEDYLTFDAALAEVRASALAALRRSDLRRREDVAELAAAYDRIDLLLRHLGAALLVDDGRVLLDYLSWRLAFLKAREQSPARLAADIDAVASVMPRTPARAGQFLQDGMQHIEWTDRPRAGRPVLRALESPAPAEHPDPSPGSLASSDVQQGQVFADLLFLAAMSCSAPMALISVAQPDGQWSTLSFGVERREALNDPSLFAAIAARGDALEIKDLSATDQWRTSPLLTGPLAVRFLYGVQLRNRSDATLGVFCVLDRRVRELNRREQQAMQAIGRQIAGQIVLWRRTATPKPAVPHPAERRRMPDRPGPDAALVDLLGLRRNGLGVDQHLLRSHEVAVLFDVTERTVINWAASKKLPSLRTAGGHLRFRSEDVLALLAGRSTPAAGATTA